MLVRIFNMIATIGFITALECTKFVFGSAPQTPRHPACFKGTYF